MEQTTAVAVDHSQALLGITQHTIYLMGGSFVLGSLVTVLFLLILDFIRRNKTSENE